MRPKFSQKLEEATAEGKTAARPASPGRPPKRVTMTDVARIAGCSQSTVSVVLNETPGVKISERTRRRVHTAIEELGYEYQRGKPAGRASESRQIAIVFDQMATSPEAVISMDGAREAAWQSGSLDSPRTGSSPGCRPQSSSSRAMCRSCFKSFSGTSP
jgi:LacI family transcriptional regulator